jgi:AcrR family transcriptional regulator
MYANEGKRMMRRSRKEMIEETKGKLVVSARHVFGQKGYTDTAMEDFTGSAGLTRGALYHHFGDKRGLLLAVVETIEDEMDERLKAASDCGLDLWQGFVRRCHLYLEMALEPEIQRIVLRDAPSILGAGYTQASERKCLVSLSSILSVLMLEGSVRAGDSEILARLINGGLVDAALWIADGDDPQDRLANAVVNLDLLLSGLKVPV